MYVEWAMKFPYCYYIVQLWGFCVQVAVPLSLYLYNVLSSTDSEWVLLGITFASSIRSITSLVNYDCDRERERC